MTNDMQNGAQTGSLMPLSDVAGAALAVMGGQGGGVLDVPKPFAEPVLLVVCTRIAGMSRIYDLGSIVGAMSEGDKLRFVREPENMHDKWAIAVLAPDGRKVGYVGADVNQILARLMDAGKQVYGKVSTITPFGRQYRIEMEVYLDD